MNNPGKAPNKVHDFGLSAHDADGETMSICSFSAGDQLFGIDTRRIREVLGGKTLEPVPLAPAFVGGVLAYRGEVLTVLCLRALLGLPAIRSSSSVLVIKTSGQDEPFGLMVDHVGGVLILDRVTFQPNPSTLDQIGKALYCGAFRMDEKLLIQLDPDQLRPSRLAETGLFRQHRHSTRPPQPETPCAH